MSAVPDAQTQILSPNPKIYLEDAAILQEQGTGFSHHILNHNLKLHACCEGPWEVRHYSMKAELEVITTRGEKPRKCVSLSSHTHCHEL